MTGFEGGRTIHWAVPFVGLIVAAFVFVGTPPAAYQA